MKLASPSKRKDPGGADNSCGRCSGSSGEGPGLECSIDLICSAGNTICACERTKMHCYFPSRINKIGKINDSPRQKKEAYKKCSFSRNSSLSELKLGRRTSPSGFRSRSKRKRYLSSYSLNNLKEKLK